MELFLLFIPAIILPIGLSLAGIWWLMSDQESGDEDYDDDIDAGF